MSRGGGQESVKNMMRIAVVAVVVAFSGCSTTPPAYYTLDMRPSGTTESVANLSVGSIVIADAIAQRNVLIRKSPTEVEYYAVGEWAGSVDELIREKLEAEFGGPVAERRTLVLTGRLLNFGQVDAPEGAVAHLKIAVEARETGKSRYSPALLSKTYDITHPAAESSANGVAAALSRCVEKLAAALVADTAGL